MGGGGAQRQWLSDLLFTRTARLFWQRPRASCSGPSALLRRSRGRWNSTHRVSGCRIDSLQEQRGSREEPDRSICAGDLKLTERGWSLYRCLRVPVVHFRRSGGRGALRVMLKAVGSAALARAPAVPGGCEWRRPPPKCVAADLARRTPAGRTDGAACGGEPGLDIGPNACFGYLPLPGIAGGAQGLGPEFRA